MATSRSLLTQSTALPHRRLHETLDALPTDASESQVRHNLALVAAAGQPAAFSELATAVLEDERLLAEIAGRSYRHVNHFDKIVLVDVGRQSGYRLTLHLWRPPYTEAEVNDELIHDHRFSFWSTVLAGELVSENFLESTTGGGTVYRRYRYVPEKSALSSVSNFYEFVGEAALERTDLSQKPAGETYHLRNVRTHRVLLPHDRMTCTLVLRGPRLRDYSHVYNRSYPDQNTRLRNTMFTPAEVAERLASLVRAVERAG
jgi:hypothetical protein